MIPEYYYRITDGEINVDLLDPTHVDMVTGRVVHKYDGCCTRWGNAVECKAREYLHIKVHGRLEEAIKLDGIEMDVGDWGHGSRASFDNPIDQNIDFEYLVRLLSPYDIPTYRLSGEKVSSEMGEETYATIVKQLFDGDVLLINKDPWSESDSDLDPTV